MKKQFFIKGLRDGVPVAIGYFAVAFSLGIAAKNAGMTPIEGFFLSFFEVASAGEYAGIKLIASQAPYIEAFLMILIINSRYLLMSFALSQKISPKASFPSRLLVAYGITDEIFALSVLRSGYLSPLYTLGLITVSVPAWAVGTSCGIIAGTLLPASVVCALGVSLYGMFIAIFVPPAKKDKKIAFAVLCGFVLSYLSTVIPFVKDISEGLRTIILICLIAGAFALLFPVSEKESEA